LGLVDPAALAYREKHQGGILIDLAPQEKGEAQSSPLSGGKREKQRRKDAGKEVALEMGRRK